MCTFVFNFYNPTIVFIHVHSSRGRMTVKLRPLTTSLLRSMRERVRLASWNRRLMKRRELLRLWLTAWSQPCWRGTRHSRRRTADWKRWHCNVHVHVHVHVPVFNYIDFQFITHFRTYQRSKRHWTSCLVKSKAWRKRYPAQKWSNRYVQ